jgi:hypothetical protein
MLESGHIRKGDILLLMLKLMPNKVKVEMAAIYKTRWKRRYRLGSPVITCASAYVVSRTTTLSQACIAYDPYYFILILS